MAATSFNLRIQAGLYLGGCMYNGIIRRIHLEIELVGVAELCSKLDVDTFRFYCMSSLCSQVFLFVLYKLRRLTLGHLNSSIGPMLGTK